MRLLVAEKRAQLLHPISEMLRDAGFKVDTFIEFDEIIAAVQAIKVYRLAVLDGESFHDVLCALIKELRRQNPRITILVAMLRNSVEERIEMLDAGADGVVVKPIPAAEIAAHCRALLRRSENGVQGVILEAGNVALNTNSSEVTVAGQQIHLTKREINLLTQLMRRQGRVVTKQHLMDSLFSFADSASVNAIEAMVSRLRRRLTTSQATVEILTEHGVGYMLAVPNASP